MCSDDRGWSENPLVYCDGQSCNVAVHQGNSNKLISTVFNLLDVLINMSTSGIRHCFINY